MKLLTNVPLLLLLTACVTQPSDNVPATARLEAKYQVLDEVLSPHHTKCSGAIKDFLKAGIYACSFKVQGLEFDIEYKYAADAKGNLKEFWPYLAEGPVMFTFTELKKDSSYLRNKSLDNFHLAFSPDRTSIFDGSHQVFIERIYPNEKLILAHKDVHTPKGRRFLYHYQYLTR